MSGNRLIRIPVYVGQLQRLKILDVSYNALTGLPDELRNLKKLEFFDVSGNDYSKQDLEIIKNQLPVGVQVVE